MALMRYQPQGRARLDQSNPLVKGLVFASVAGGPDLVSGTMPMRLGAAANGAFEQGKTLYTPGTASDGLYWPLPSNHPLYSITTQDTIFVLARRISGVAYNNMLGVPYRSGAWANPYYAWGLSSQSAGTEGSWTIALDSSSRASRTTAGVFYQNGVTQAYGYSRSGTKFQFYRGRNALEAEAAIASASPDWSNKQPLVLFNKSNTSPGDGMQAHAGVVLVWNRGLSAAEWASLSDNPWQLFADTYEDDDLTIAAPSGLTLTPGAASLSLTGYAPSVTRATTLAPGSAAMTLTGYAPAITRATVLSPSGVSLAVTGNMPQVAQAVKLSPAGASLGLAGYAPGVSQAAPITLSPQGYAFTLVTDAPLVSQGVTAAPVVDGGGAGSLRDVRAFADLLDKAHKPSRSQKKARRKQLEAEALELLPDLPEAEKLAPIAARIVYEQEARAKAPLYAVRPIQAMAPVAIPFNAHEALRELIEKLLAEAELQQKVAEDEENDIELLLFGT